MYWVELLRGMGCWVYVECVGCRRNVGDGLEGVEEEGGDCLSNVPCPGRRGGIQVRGLGSTLLISWQGMESGP